MNEELYEDEKKPLTEHLLELRKCLIRSFIGWVFGAVISYIFAEKIITFLVSPLYNILPVSSNEVFFRTFTEVFGVYIKLSLIMGFIIGSPYIFFQIWSFLAPGLYPHEKKWVKSAVILTSFSFIIGSFIAYYIFLPIILKFFYSFGKDFLVFKPFLKEYISFVLKIFIIFGILFQVPSFLVLLAKLGLINSENLKKFRAYAIILAFLISAILTSGTDPLNQILLALPLTLLYEIGIILVRIIEIQRR